ncbi:hemagglutinin repeat-containing protein [Rhizobium croatiense]|uniref:Hemagglutinin repeat-containing protein n=1 Tax=Rhizobium croatiense TaxID=2867516 RepID=A0ABS7LYM1_9HYPH|nr:hemagglutinin repeat-containing protein [Rhizobium croatiense]MBY4629957.1 hemagglutinin repeat-containing protein [Rhizobium croatiense]
MSEERLGRTAATRGVAGANERTGLRPARLFRQSLALLLSSLLVLQPMLANAQSVSASTTAPAANQPGVGTAPNGVPLIDIVTPNSQGLSHNKYDNFNVGTPGLILNNYKGEIGNSNLGGVTPGNANLNTSGPASVILNEVISGNRSALNGAIEVFGGRADVVIANPNGITCDGCGFINTPHATLTTGVPDISADGALKGFTVNGGDVTIGPNGGNFAAGPGAVDLFDIVSRSVHVNGPVYGKDLRVTAGRNQFDYATGNATPLAATSGTPEYAIDGSALGAMQADRIKIVVTEQGAGVRMSGNLAANTNELSLSADGKISLGNVSGQQGVSISSKAKVMASKVTSKAKIAVQAHQGITLDTVAADDDILLSSGSGLLSVGGEVSSAADVEIASDAGIAAGSVMAGQTLTLSATSGDIQIAGAAKSGDALAITATSGTIAAASLVSGNNLTLSAGADIAVSGDVLAEGDVTASGSSIAASTIASGVDLAATAQSANAALVLQPAGDMSLAATNGSITVSNALLSSGDLSANAGQNLAYSKLQSLGSADLSASGQISYGNPTSAKGNLTLTTTTIDLSNGGAGNIAAGGTLMLNADSANLSNNSLTLGGLTLNLSDAADLSGTRINAVTNAGGSGDIAINAGGLSTSAGTALLAAHDLTLTLPSLTNAGQLAAGDDLTLNISGNFTNSATGLAYAGHDAGLFIGEVLTNNQGAILAGNDLEIAGTTSGLRNTEVTNISGLIQAGNDMSILTANLTNRRAVTPQWTAGTLVSSGVVSGFTLNPVAAGLPFGYLETADQNMYQLYAGVDPGLWQDYQPLLWSKATLADGTTYRAWTWISADGPEKVEPIIDWIRNRVPRDANGNPVADPNNPSRYFIVDEVNFSGSDESTTYSWDWSSHLSQSVYEDRLVGTLSPEATIRASRNLTVDATNLTNAYSSIEACGSATLKGSTLTNTGVSLFRTTTTTCHAQGACTAYNANGTANPSKNIANGSTIVSSVEAIGGVSANIKAGGALSVDFGSVSNTSAAGSMAGGASVTAAGSPGDPLSALSGLTAGGALFNVNAGLGGAALLPPANPKSGGFGGKIAHQTFLFETRAAYLDVGTFYGSGYFMDKIGYQPETTVPFLGDAYFENQLIDTQLRQLVGEGLGRSTFIAGDSAIKQMKTLLDNGATYANDHGLAVGQGLTPEQAAALTESIVLYQWQTVNGVQVLAPVVYVAAADRQKLTGAGAAMAGGSVNMNVGNLDNSGLIASAGGLTVSGSSIQGSGTFLSRGDTTLNATNGITLAAQTMTIGGRNVVNTNAGVTAGGTLQLAGGSGDLALRGVKVNATDDVKLSGQNVTLDAAKVGNDGQQNATGTQVAGGKALTIKANDNVNVIGSSAKAGTTLDVTADKGSVAVVSTDVARDNHSGYTRTLSTDQQQSQLSAGTNATIKTGDDILLSGSSVEAKGNVALNAGDDINITAAQEHSASTFGKKSSSSITHVGSEISAGGDLSVTAGNSSGDHDLNIVGSKLTADGKVGLKADGDVTIAEATDTATLDTKLSIKGGFLGSSEKTTTHLETTTAVGSAITGGGGVDIESGKDTVISASKIEADKEAGAAANLNITTGGDLVIASGMDTSAKNDKGSRSGFLSKGSSSYKSYDETTIASELGASGNINLNAGGAAVIAGSKANADGSISIEGDSVSLIGAAELHELEITRKKSGLFVGSGNGFISLWGAEQKSGSQASALNVASVLSAGTDVALKSRETDVNIIGSSIDAGQDLTLDAARDVNITPGAESASSEEKEKRSGFGIAFSSGNGGASISIGFGKSVDQTAQSSATNAVSTLSAGRDLTISAGRDANLQAAQVTAEHDVAILTGRDVNLLLAQDQTNYEHLHEEFFAGITLSVSSGLVSAAESVQSAASGIGDNAGLYAAAPTVLAALNAYKTLDSISKGDSSLASVSLTAGFNYQKYENAASSSSPVVTSVRAGGAIAIEATSGDLTGHGVQLAAGYDANGNPTVSGDANAGNVLLSAGHDITLESAQATNDSSSKSMSAGASIGVGAEIGGPNGGGIGVTGSASVGMGKVGETGVTQLNSHVMGTGAVALNSGNDTTLKGAVVSGNTVIANVGGNLNIVSQQDTAAYRETTAGASIGLSPTGALSGGASTGKVKGDYVNVSEQSGIVAGGGGYHVAAGGTVDLKGGVIASTTDPRNNELSAKALTYSNIANASIASTSGYGVVLSPSGIPLPAVDTPANQEDHGVALATLSPGKLTLSEQKQDLTGLNADLSKANTQADFYDIETLKRRQESAAAVSQLLNMAIGEISQKLGFAEGSPEKIGLHAAAGALTAIVAGGNVGLGALAGGGQELLGAIINKALMDNPNLTQEQRNAISQWTATLVGAVIGGNQGAAIALDAEKYNRQLHIKEGELIRANAARYAVQQGYCASVDSCSAEGITRAEAELTMEALRRVDSLFADVNESSAAAAFLDKLAAAASSALPDGQNLFSATPDQYTNHVMNIEYLSQNKELYERFGNQNESKYYTAYVHALLSAANDSGDLKDATPAQTSAVLNGLKDAIHAIEQGQAGSTGFENTIGGSETTYINLLDGMINAVTIAAGSNSSALQQFITENHALVDGLMSNVAFESKVGKLIQVEYLLAVAGPAAASMAAELAAACRLGSQVCLTQINLLFQDFIASAPELGGTGVGLSALTTLDKKAIEQAALKVDTQILGRKVWSLNPIVRGNSVESLLAQTEYSSANGWFHIGAEKNGFFPLIDFQSGNTVISLKTVNTTGSSWMGRMERTIDELSGSGITINGNPAKKILDIRVQPGGAAAAQALVDYGRSEGITVLIKEF